MLAGPQWDVIHFNSGLHDLKRVNRKPGRKHDDPTIPTVLTLDQYRENLDKIVARMKKTGAKLIFATTTPYPDGVYPCRLPRDAVAYNKVALEVMKKHDVSVNDLYSASLPNLKAWQREKNVHFSPFGREKLAELVAEAVRKQFTEEKKK